MLNLASLLRSKRTALPAKRIKTNKDCKNNNNNVQLVRDNIEELIYISKVKHTYVQAYTVPYLNLKKYLSNSTENLIDKFYKGKNIQLLRPANVANVFDIVISKSDKVPTQEPSSYIKTELYPHQKQALYFIHKFYHLIITSKDTHYKQIIKKAYIMSLERASLILFIT
ncbi:hypothetical protein HBH70_079620 [Parastagonospora nodorum]|nr:hypothetical protein HBH70_079620 [Parastagonospora nodorum]